MARGPDLSPEMQAYAATAAIGMALVLLADLALLWVMVASRLRGKPLLARRWSAAHVLIAFQGWLLITLGFGIAADALSPSEPARSAAAHVQLQLAPALVVALLVVQNL